MKPFRTLTLLLGISADAYDSGIFDAVTGETSFAVAFAAPVTFDVDGGASFDATSAGTVTLTYNYTPSAVPEPSTYAASSAD